jgi:16S rRNA (guanine966-N2)-methyltransferase
VLDLFAGSGALAIEALSRGAARATLVERDRRAAAVVRRNLDDLGLAEAATLHVRDALRVLRDAHNAGDAYDLVLIDPPYRLAAGLGPVLSDLLPPVLAPGGRVVTESDRRHPLELASLEPTFERRYGDTLLRIHSA